jgi:hypothetical protein
MVLTCQVLVGLAEISIAVLGWKLQQFLGLGDSVVHHTFGHLISPSLNHLSQEQQRVQDGPVRESHFVAQIAEIVFVHIDLLFKIYEVNLGNGTEFVLAQGVLSEASWILANMRIDHLDHNSPQLGIPYHLYKTDTTITHDI